MKSTIYQVYVRTDEHNRIIAVNSSAFLMNTEGWMQIDEGTEWPKYMHAQNNYFPQPIYTEDGFCCYKMVDGAAVERTEEEIKADRAAQPAPLPSETELLRQDVDAITAAIERGLSL